MEIKLQLFDMVITPEGRLGSRRLLLSFLLLAVWKVGSGQVHYSVSEEAKHGTFVGRIAQDLGLELAELVPRLFRVASKGSGDLLEVNLQNGILFVNSRIDREELCGRSLECSIHLEVIVDRPLQVFHVEVEVRDINDNPPVFRLKEQRMLIYESRLPDSLFPLEGASDADVGSNSILTYKLTSSEYFALNVKTNSDDNTQIGLVLRKSLDREEAPEHSLLLTATDEGKPELTGAVQLLVTVLDVNDNAPSFEQSEYEVRIFENSDNGTIVIRLNASDRDEGANAEISYSFISTTRALDEADLPRQRLLVLVKDHGEPALTATATVLLSLVESGQTPKASSRTLEGAAGPRVALMDVNVYLIIAICAVSSLLVLTLLLYTALRCSAPLEGACGPGKPRLVCSSAVESWSYSQQRRQKVCSGEGPPKTDLMAFSPSLPPCPVATDVVEHQDLNDDHYAKTGSGQVHYSISEEAKHGTFVGRIAQDLGLELAELVPRLFRLDSRFPLEGASDADIGENALLTYRLSPSEYFSLDVPTNDEQVKPLGLVLRKPLDREESPELHLVLTATDRGKPELTGTVQLLVKVLDANDNAPAFDRTLYAVKLPENVPNGTLVIKLKASDLDEGLNGDIIYSFSSDVSSDIKSKFYIDPISGEIISIGHIDFEESKAYKIRVEAIDKGFPSLAGHCTVLVEVLDANDNAPELTVTSLSLPVSEDAQPGTVITLINVSDRDSGADGQVTCSLTPHVPFKLVSTFKNYYSLVLDSALDRESVANYQLVVTARDGGSPSLSATASVSVEVADVNDNAPTTRALDEADLPRQRLLVLVKDHGEPALTATATVLLSLVESGQAPKASSRASKGTTDPEVTLVDVNVYLIIAICAVSSLLVLTLLLYTALRCSAPPTEGECGPGKPRLVCSSAVESWSYSQQRRQRQQRACSGEGPPKTDLIAFSPSLPQGPKSTDNPLDVAVYKEVLSSQDPDFPLTVSVSKCRTMADAAELD
ncbi:PREDICTED: protocadherin alpha-5-like [Ceratotherium simum simum]|uniref:Protocadherin alpha-5-like n=1 Tax=Ceratotherium simum simum TaxID=73337 RepID=A0ABM1DCF1_CERSS|nr:PREDICTED: protocadherin alpha-5-like [Ceratotherium simum simum]